MPNLGNIALYLVMITNNTAGLMYSDVSRCGNLGVIGHDSRQFSAEIDIVQTKTYMEHTRLYIAPWIGQIITTYIALSH